MSDMLFHSSLRANQQVLDLRQRQHAMTASNLANADTPGFRARFIDFTEVLSDVTGTSDTPRMTRTHALHLPEQGGAASPEIVEVDPPGWSTSGNSVFPEQEHARMRSNALLYDGLTRGVSRQLAILKFAAADGRG